MKSRKSRIIEQLRKQYPGKWEYKRINGYWVGPDFEVRAYSYLASSNGCDERFYIQYHRDDTGERLSIADFRTYK